MYIFFLHILIFASLGTMLPAPLINMNLVLFGKNIIYIPPKEELHDTFDTILEEIIHIMSTIPRIYEKFTLPPGGLKKFWEVISNDPDCNKLQSLVTEGK